MQMAENMPAAEWAKCVPAGWMREDCRCCLHQQKLAGWQRAKWCKPECVYRHFPEEVGMEWELTQRCLEPYPISIPAGMGSVTQLEWRVSSDEFRLQMQMAQMPIRFWEELREAVARFAALWQKFKDGKTPFGEAEMSELRRLSIVGAVDGGDEGEG